MKYTIPFLISFALVFSTLFGCASSPSGTDDTSSSVLSVELNILSEKTIANRYGVDRKMNPYFPNPVLILPSKDEFVVLELVIQSKTPMHVEFDYARLVSESGAQVGQFLERNALIEYWAGQANTETIEKRKNMIGMTYLPDWVFDRRPGKRSYVLVLSGKRPIPRPFEVVARVWVNKEPYEFRIPVTE